MAPWRASGAPSFRRGFVRVSTAATPAITSGDRLSLTLFVSLAVHALVILGVGFTWVLDQQRREPPMIEITLAERPQEQAPEEFDFLAQANQDGGGESETPERPQKPQEALAPGVPEGQAAVSAAPKPTPAPQPRTDPSVRGTDRNRLAAPAPESHTEAKPRPSRAELLNDVRQVAAESDFSEITESVSARYPTKRRIDARTKSHAAAAYMRQWVDKVERVGNLNYPHEVRTRNLAGRLILEVTLAPDGRVYNLQVLRPSSYRALDDAAQRIVGLAAPFAPVPEAVLQGDDLLVITRTWEFTAESAFQSN